MNVRARGFLLLFMRVALLIVIIISTLVVFLRKNILYLDLDGFLCAFPEKTVCPSQQTLESLISNKMWFHHKKRHTLRLISSMERRLFGFWSCCTRTPWCPLALYARSQDLRQIFHPAQLVVSYYYLLLKYMYA